MPNQRDERLDDLQLVREALTGDPRAADGLIARLKCVPQILHVKNVQAGSPIGRDDLRDLTQDTLELIWRKLGSYEGRSSLETWAYAYCQHMLLNAIRNKRRRQARQRETDVELLLDNKPDTAEREHDFDALRRGLEGLDPNQALVIRLKHFESVTFEEIAASLQMSVNTVKTQYYRGLTKLRESLEQRLREEYA